MKVTFVGHASILIEAGGISILSDPWWRGPCFGAQWWNYPLPALGVLDRVTPDYIYISHGHHDHLHPGTLKLFSRATVVLVAQSTGLAGFIRTMGFTVIEVGEHEIELGDSGVRCRIIPTHSDDTLMAVSDGREVCVNINDALHSAPDHIQREMIGRLHGLYPRIDYVFCGYGTASHFPNCYIVPGKDRAATAARRQAHFNREWAKLIAALRPRFGFPFAADVALLEHDLLWVNEPAHNAERPTAAFHAAYPESAVTVLDIAPGFVIEDGVVRDGRIRQPVRTATLMEECKEQIARANRYGNASPEVLAEVAALLQASIDANRAYLLTDQRDYRFLIRFRNCDTGMLIQKRGSELSLTTVDTGAARLPAFDVMYTTRLHYLRNSLAQRYGNEILFVGSGGVFEYVDAALAAGNLHRELQLMLKKPGKTPPTPRYGGESKPAYILKQVLKQMYGQGTLDLYNLKYWTVFSRARLPAPRPHQEKHAA